MKFAVGHGSTGRDSEKRKKLTELLDGNLAEIAPEQQGPSGQPPLMWWALRSRAVLVTNIRLLNRLMSCYGVAAQQPALKEWLRKWVCPFEWRLGVETKFIPDPKFEMPAAVEPPGGGEDLYLSGGGFVDSPGARSTASIHRVLETKLADPVSALFSKEALRIVDQQELPSVAVRRRSELHRLAHRVHELCTDADDAERAAFRFADRKAAWDVMNKLVNYVKSNPSAASASSKEPLIPSCPATDPEVVRWLSDQLQTAYPELLPHAATANAERLLSHCSAAATALSQFAVEESSKWRMRLGAGKSLDDTTVGMSLRPLLEDERCVEVAFRDPHREEGGRHDEDYSEHTVELWKLHFDRLKIAYRAAGHSSLLFLTRVFVMVTRYDAMSEDKSAYQAALPRRMMQILENEMDVRHECYASPLNRFFGSYCSAFRDTDGFFGAVGTFQSFTPTEGSFEANPPFDQASVASCFRHIGSLLPRATGPLSFTVVIPAMDFSPKLKAAFDTIRPFLRKEVMVPSGKHVYLMGLQHRKTGAGQDGERYWEPEKSSCLYFLQNDAAHAKWDPEPVTHVTTT
jgi:phosphorylated CTD-interacting factor 1